MLMRACRPLPRRLPFQCSTSIVSLGKTVVRKTQVAEAVPESGRFVYNLNRAPLCPYIVTCVQGIVPSYFPARDVDAPLSAGVVSSLWLILCLRLRVPPARPASICLCASETTNHR